MRHRKTGKKFHRMVGDRRPFLRNLANDVIRAGRVETTEVRAKAIRPVVEKLVTLAKKQTLAARRLVFSRVQNKRIATKLYEEIAPRYAGRAGGYLRITKLATSRKRDGSPLAVVEFV
jgi:large subunit ribosomal protein L17